MARSLGALYDLLNNTPPESRTNCSLNTLTGSPSTIISLGIDFEMPSDFVNYDNAAEDIHVGGQTKGQISIDTGLSYGIYASLIYVNTVFIGNSVDPTIVSDPGILYNWDGNTGNMTFDGIGVVNQFTTITLNPNTYLATFFENKLRLSSTCRIILL